MFHQRDKTKEQCKFIFGMEMIACPSCGSYNLGFQTPIKTKGGETLKQLVAMSIRGGNELEGPVYIKCWKCHHAGPSLDCAGRTRDDVGRDAHVAATVKALWNSQTSQPVTEQRENALAMPTASDGRPQTVTTNFEPLASADGSDSGGVESNK